MEVSELTVEFNAEARGYLDACESSAAIHVKRLLLRDDWDKYKWHLVRRGGARIAGVCRVDVANPVNIKYSFWADADACHALVASCFVPEGEPRSCVDELDSHAGA